MQGCGTASPGSRASFLRFDGERRLQAEITEIAASQAGAEEKAVALLEPLRRLVRYDAAWMALRDPTSGRQLPVVQDGDTRALRAYMETDDADPEMQQLGLQRLGWPTLAHRLPVPLEETVAWGEFLLPAGFCDGLAVALFTHDRRHVGDLILLTSRPREVTAIAAGLLHTVNPVLATVVDDMRPRPGAATSRISDPAAARSTPVAGGSRAAPSATRPAGRR